MKKWLIVHSQKSYNINQNIIGFDYEKANNIQPDDYIIYYIKGGSIKGLYKVSNKPWGKEKAWSAKIQIELNPIIVLEKAIDFKPVISRLKLFENNPEKWGTQLQGSNNIKELSEHDFIIIENLIYETNFIETVEHSMKDNKSREKRLSSANKIPEQTVASVIRYKRNPDVVAAVLIRANGICEECNQKAPFLRAKDNSPYLEVHHKVQLSQKGEDTVKNAIAVCPNCHKKLHYG